MPTIRIAVDDVVVASVSTGSHQILSVRAGGTRDKEDLAALDVSASSLPENGPSQYRIWISGMPLFEGQTVLVSLHEQGSDSHRGKSIAELFPDDEPDAETAPGIDFTITDEIIQEIRNRPTFHETYKMSYRSSTGLHGTMQTEAGHHGFAFSLVWDWLHPAQARFSLHAYSLDDLRARRIGEYIFNDVLAIGDQVSLQLLGAP